MGIHAPRSDNGSTMARTTAQLQNLKRNRMSGCSKFHFKLNSSRRCCRFQVVDPVAKRSGNEKNAQGCWELEEIIVKGYIRISWNISVAISQSFCLGSNPDT
jgi:hypothetical protein